MKNTFKIILSSLCLIAGLSFSSCKNDKEDSSKDVAEDQNKTEFNDNKQDKNNAQFVVDVAAANYYEIGLSKYAADRSATKDVKDMAHMIVRDHGIALNDLKTVAAHNSISIPNEDTARVNDKIRSWRDKKQSDFEKAYIDEMVNEHKNAVDKLEKGANGDVNNNDVTAWINSTLPVVRTHLQKFTDMQKMMK